MNLKAKLYILKNHALLLLGPSPFEHWFESYLCIIVEFLSFLEFATRSLFVYLSLPLLCSPLPCAAAVLPAMCAAPASLRCSGPRHVPPRPLPRRDTSPDCLPELCFAAARHRHTTRATSCLSTFHASLFCRAAVSHPIYKEHKSSNHICARIKSRIYTTESSRYHNTYHE
jgi:hypothetical protein